MSPKDISYSGGLFFLNIKFPDYYPQGSPEVCFKTPIYRVNVKPHRLKFTGDYHLGYVCFSILNCWKPECIIREVLLNIFVLLYSVNPDTAFSLERNVEFIKNRPLFEKKN